MKPVRPGASVVGIRTKLRLVIFTLVSPGAAEAADPVARASPLDAITTPRVAATSRMAGRFMLITVDPPWMRAAADTART